MSDITDISPGTRIRLVSCTDPWTDLPPGICGTVTFVDGHGTVFADWDDGSRLGLLAGVDEYSLAADSPPTA